MRFVLLLLALIVTEAIVASVMRHLGAPDWAIFGLALAIGWVWPQP